MGDQLAALDPPSDRLLADLEVIRRLRDREKAAKIAERIRSWFSHHRHPIESGAAAGGPNPLLRSARMAKGTQLTDPTIAARLGGQEVVRAVSALAVLERLVGSHGWVPCADTWGRTAPTSKAQINVTPNYNWA